MDNAGGDVEVVTAHGTYRHIGGGGYHCRALQVALALQFFRFGLVIVVDDIERDQFVFLAWVFDDECEVHQFVDGLRVGNRYQELFFFFRFVLVQQYFLFDGDAAGGAFGGKGADDTGKENHDYGAVQHIVVEQALAVFHDNAVPDKDGGKGGGCLCITQPEHHVAFFGFHVVDLLGNPCGNPFAGGCHDGHYYRHFQRFSACEEAADVNDHAYSDQEVRDEEGVADKFQTVHQGGHVRHEAVQHQSGEECAEDTFHPHKLHQSAAEKHHREHEDKLHHAVFVFPEEPATDAGEEENDEESQKDYFQQQEHPVQAVDVSFVHASDDGEYQKRQGYRDGGSADGDAHTPQARQAVAAYDGVGDQRVRGIHTGEEHGGGQPVVQQAHAAPYAENHRDEEGEETENERFDPVLLEVFHIHLQAGKEHDVVEPHFSEQLETAVALQDIKSVLPYDNSGKNHTDDMRDVQTPQHHRGKQDDGEHQEEHPCGVRYREL